MINTPRTDAVGRHGTLIFTEGLVQGALGSKQEEWAPAEEMRKLERELAERKSRIATLQQLLSALHESIDLSTAAEIQTACELIIEVQVMDDAERACIRASYKHGPLFDGDLPSKSARDRLLDKGHMVKVVANGQDGYNACTHNGAWVYRLLEAGA